LWVLGTCHFNARGLIQGFKGDARFVLLLPVPVSAAKGYDGYLVGSERIVYLVGSERNCGTKMKR